MKERNFRKYLSPSGFPKVGKVALLGAGLILQLIMGLDVVGAEEGKQAWQVEWDKTVKAAKKEGQVNLYVFTTMAAVVDSGVFQKAYPGIKVVRVSGRGYQNRQRILAERRAGKYLADVLSSGVTTYAGIGLEPVKPALILPEVLDESKWWQGKHRYADPEGQYIFIYAGIPQLGSITYNTNLVDPKEFKSFWDFLNPKWKGKMEARDVRVPGPGAGAMRFYYHNPKLGPKFIRQLITQTDLTLFRGIREGTDWLARGKFAICFFCGGVDIARNQGLPVDFFGVMKEGAGLVAQWGTIGLVNKGPHPNAAKVFVNWFLSPEGQLTLQKALARAGESAPNSLRIDIPKDDVYKENRRVKGLEYIDMNTPERADMRPVRRLLNEILAEGGKK